MALIEKVCLTYREGASDKVYEIHLTQDEGGESAGFRVTGYNGRRGAKLVAQPKTERAVPYRTARYIFDNLEAAKLNHRRTPYQISRREKLVDMEAMTLEKQAASASVTSPTSAAPTLNASSAARNPASSPPEDQTRTYRAEFLDALELE